jgi:[acyl-carrier-protein] S-malonyltransferase
MFVCAVATLAAMRQNLGEKMPQATMMAGLSLGEYTALHASGAMSFESALNLVAHRGRLMQQAAVAAPSGMVSVMGLDEAKVRELCAAARQGAVLVPANFNAPGQIVIAGDLTACARAAEAAKDFGASGAMALKVAGAFHSPFMQPAADQLGTVLAQTAMQAPTTTVIANVDARPHGDAESIKAKLVAQVTSPVRWEQSIRYMLDNGVNQFYEIGPGKVLAGLMRRIERRASIVSVNSAEALASLAAAMA